MYSGVPPSPIFIKFTQVCDFPARLRFVKHKLEDNEIFSKYATNDT